MEVYILSADVALCAAPHLRKGKTYTSTGASDPTPVVKFAAKLWDEIRRVLGILGLDKVVVVGSDRNGLFFGGGHGGLARTSVGAEQCLAHK
ncbi:hypothetical protein F1880_004228 [Penicillium rolfsii]|nr:hypothetical protein F1880_004228 [Penicillium rolfsii]